MGQLYNLKKGDPMKKLLLLAVLAIASQVQAREHYNHGQTCGEYVKCDGSVREGQTFKCPDCVCPEVRCPILPEVVCEAKAVPVKTAMCPETARKTCGHCHKPRVHGCKSGNCCQGTGSCSRYETVAGEATEKKQMRTPKRVQTSKAAATK